MCGSELASLPKSRPESPPESVAKVARALHETGHTHTPIMLEKACRTSQEAAAALNVTLGQIAKSVIFKGENDQAVLVVAAGDRRVDEGKVAAIVGKLSRADADFVRSKTGFPIGGVSPLAHATPCVTLLDASLKRFESLWAAAGHPNSVFCLTPDDLCRLTGAAFVEVT
jgi:prolyl-tRNA editing enzyme YbaK/EbsC (Cys-tRNA(Pro) deacylase)